MTGFYEFFGKVDDIDVSCPVCRHQAHFTYAHILRLAKKADANVFSDAGFVVQDFNLRQGHKWPGVVIFPAQLGLHWRRYLPEDYQCAGTILHWADTACTDGTDLGWIVCPHCQLSGKHLLDWPNDAFFIISLKGQSLWAYRRSMFEIIRDYLAAPHRDTRLEHEHVILRHLPTIFKLAKNRRTVIRKMNQCLAAD